MHKLLRWFAVLMAATAPVAQAAPMTVNGDPFVLVANGPGTTQLFMLTADTQGRVYAGNNSNNTTGIPVQRFDPSLFAGSPIALQNFGPNVGDADGLAFGNGFIHVADRDQGLRRIAVLTGTHTVFIPGAAINGTGSPFIFRPGDSHLFVGRGGLTGDNHIDEYHAAGTFLRSFVTGTDVESMAFDPASGRIYYAPFGSAVRALIPDPLAPQDLAVGTSSGTIDGGLAFDAISGRIFVGTANGVNSGLVETIDPNTGITSAFASGFNGSLGILREGVSGDLYFLEQNDLYRLSSSAVGPIVPPQGVPEPATLLLCIAGLAALARRQRQNRRHPSFASR